MSDTTTLTTTTAAPTDIVILDTPPPADRNPARVYIASLSTPVSRAGMASNIRSVVNLMAPGIDPDLFPWAALTTAHTKALRTKLQEPVAVGEPAPAPATVNIKLAAVRGVLNAAWELEQINTDRMLRMKKTLKSVRGSRLPAGRAVAPGEVNALFRATADGTPIGARDAAMLALLIGGGLRRAEAAAVRTADVEPDENGLTIRVLGKGGKERQVYADNGGGLAIADWLKVRGSEPGPLLCRVDKTGRVSPRSDMTPAAIRLRLVRRCEQAGIKPATPHDLRRTFVSELLDAGQDIASVQRLVGHANVATTIRYDRRGERAARRAASMMHVPYVAG